MAGWGVIVGDVVVAPPAGGVTTRVLPIRLQSAPQPGPPSHCSLAAALTIPSPQRDRLQVRCRQVALSRAPASHSSPAAALTILSPQREVLQVRCRQVAVSRAPSSHCSPAARLSRPSPHLGAVQSASQVRVPR